MPANTTHGFPYPLPSEPVAEGAQAIRNLAEAVDTRLAGYGTALPASPVDGQRFVLTDSLTAPTWVWEFRYNAGSGSVYKWEAIGAAIPRRTASAAFQAIGGTANVWQFLSGPQLVAPRAGEYRIEQMAGIYHSGGSGSPIVYTNFDRASAPTVPSALAHGQVALPVGAIAFAHALGGTLVLAAGEAAREIVNSPNVGGDLQIGNRYLTMWPIRVS